MLELQRLFPTALIENSPTGSFFTKSGAPIKVGNKGKADITAIILGRGVEIEIKVQGDRQSQDQKDRQKKIERAGGVYLLVRDTVSTLHQGLVSWGFDISGR